LELEKPLEEYQTVRTWFEGLREHWGEEPPDKEGKLATLQSFCEMVGKDPDAIVEECSREVEGGKRIRIKARRLYTEKIEEFKGSVRGAPRDQGKAANTVRSFMIHNGIFMQGGVQG
jgi:hypothetical protein